MRHKTLSCHPRNYELDSLTLLKGAHPPIFLPYHMGTVSVLKTDIKGDRLPHSMREKRGGLQQLFPYI